MIKELENGNLLDLQTGYEWEGFDPERRMSLKELEAYVKALGDGWEVPSMKDWGTVSLESMGCPDPAAKLWFWSRNLCRSIENVHLGIAYGKLSLIMKGTFTPDPYFMSALLPSENKYHVRCVKKFK